MGKFLLDIPDDLHRKIKIMAVVENTTMRDILIEALRQYLAKKEKE